MIFFFSKTYFKFNIDLDLKQLGIEKDNNLKGKKVIFVNLVKEQGNCRISLLETAFTILEKEKRQQQLNGDIFSLSDQREKMNKIITSFFADRSLWRIQVDTALDEILNLE